MIPSAERRKKKMPKIIVYSANHPSKIKAKIKTFPSRQVRYNSLLALLFLP